ncbi:MAG TPA: alpha/beta fold hydrolase [Clostridia bacterium]
MKVFIKRLISVLLASIFVFMLSFNYSLNLDHEKENLRKELEAIIYQKSSSFLKLSQAQDNEVYVEDSELPEGYVQEDNLEEVFNAISELSYDGQIYEEIPEEYIDAPVVEIDLTQAQTLEQEVVEDYNSIVPAYNVKQVFSKADNEITILTPGVGGDASNWSNNGTPMFSEGTYTIVDKLKGLVGGTFYRVNTRTNNGTVSYSIYKQYSYSTIELDDIDFAKHNIFIIESNSAEDYHSVVYKEFKAFLIDYLKKDPGAKVNLIGHSRGGLINLMYASEFPNNVSRLISIGTPYFPNILAMLSSAINALPDFWIVKDFKDWIASLAPHCNAYSDLASISVSYNLLTNWNEAYKINPSIKAYAIGTATGYSITLYVPQISYVKIGFIKVPYIYLAAITLGIGIDHDGLVGTNSQLAMNIGGSFGYIQMPNASINYVQGFYRKKFYITIGDIVEAAKYKKLASPNQPAVPHNMQPRYAPIIDYIYSIY